MNFKGPLKQIDLHYDMCWIEILRIESIYVLFLVC